MSATEKIKKLDELFGSYKAEWLRGKIFEFFETPYYFCALQGNRPCVLQGGRGTGKTTVLRGLSYQGQYAILDKNIERFDQNNYIGIYYRVNTNHVHAFKGRGIGEDEWDNLFAHYFNLLICWEISEFVKWHKKLSSNDEVLPIHACKLIATSLHLKGEIGSFEELQRELEVEMYHFQSDVNNIKDQDMPRLSMLGDPIKLYTEQVLQLSQFEDKMFYLLIDEYENLLDHQQQTINTLLKHAPESYTFKIGVREMGWRVKYTLNKQELLNDPADYALTDITEQFTSKEGEQHFNDFARDVCQRRISELLPEIGEEFKIGDALPGLSIEEESELLGVTNTDYYKAFVEYEKVHKSEFNIHPLYKAFIAYWAETHNEVLDDTIKNYQSYPSPWDVRYDNYKYSLLFKIKRGRGAGGIQKYYAGWNTFLKLANGNIRYLMELVYKSYYVFLQQDGDITRPVPPALQTEAARTVGLKNLGELEAEYSKGAQITKLVQAIGSLFSKIAVYGDKTAPEAVQFEIEDEMSDSTKEIIDASVMNLALIKMSSNKMSGMEIKKYQYSLHPIFAPYFLFSFRRKRKMFLKDKDIQGFIDSPVETVREVLKRRKIRVTEEEQPRQLSIFDNLQQR